MLPTSKSRYAVLALSDMATHSSGAIISLPEIADRHGISIHYLEQLFVKLRKGGIVVSVRGYGGGYKLGREPQEISIWDVLEAVGEKGCSPANVEKQNQTHRLNSSLETSNSEFWEVYLIKIQEALSQLSITDTLPAEENLINS